VDFEQVYLWESFAKLVEMDTDGDYTADVIDSFYDVSEIDAGVAALERLIEENPDRLDLYMNLAALHLAAYDSPAALPLLVRAKSLAKTTSQLADIERMALMANDSEFEYRFGEVMSILDAGNKLQANDVEFLEDLVEQAPHAIEGHLALARSYYAWEEYDEALEVLLDAQESFPDQPSILDWLARILWESGERETAFTYLNRGILAQPFNVQLIARAGQYLFDNDQLIEARRYLARAESIQPKHPMLNAVRNYIAQKIADNPNKYRDI
ncbi:MAG: tetratricopeptide repeat protein, partial [Phototrophicaceae bacterium]